jgi:hypothetical protein
VNFAAASIHHLVLACPSCARDNDSTSTAWWIGVSLLMPLVISGAVALVLVRANSREQGRG